MDFKDSLTEFKYSLMQFRGSLMEFKDSLMEFRGSLMEFKGSLMEFKGSLMEFKDSLMEFKYSLDLLHKSKIRTPPRQSYALSPLPLARGGVGGGVLGTFATGLFTIPNAPCPI
ncbi:MAG: hypothetical protein RMX97_00985 [Nostoc sp. DedQUE11]|nr:hypothetical protein [Nostoc sp. DedQUE11]